MRRDLVAEDHEAFRELASVFVEKEVVPAYPEWEKGAGLASRCHMTSATFSLKPYYSASATNGGGVPASSREKESQHEDESIDGHGQWRSGSLGRWCYVDRTIGLGR
jgi:hypothetical protein